MGRVYPYRFLEKLLRKTVNTEKVVVTYSPHFHYFYFATPPTTTYDRKLVPLIHPIKAFFDYEHDQHQFIIGA